MAGCVSRYLDRLQDDQDGGDGGGDGGSQEKWKYGVVHGC